MKRLLPLIFLLVTSVALGQRTAPTPVDPIDYDDRLQFRVPHYQVEGMSHNGGYIEVVDKKSGKRVCLSKIYNVVYSTVIDKGLQENFIVSTRLKGELLVVMNERGERIKKPVSYLCD